MKIPRLIPDARNPRSLEEAVALLLRAASGRLEVGSPQDPNDPASTTLADGATHNGEIVNLLGSWVEVEVTALDTKVDCAHNLNSPVTVVGGTNQPNVRWWICGYQHDGQAATSTAVPGTVYEPTDAGSITADSFPLRFYCAATRTIDGDHPLKVTLWFTPATR